MVGITASFAALTLVWFRRNVLYIYYIEGILYSIPVVIIALFARHRLHAAISAGLMITFFYIIVAVPLRDISISKDEFMSSLVALAGIWILPMILLSVAPAKAISRRLIFLALGLLLLIALNELSKLGLDLTAPKLQG
jgi:hypothetical protein